MLRLGILVILDAGEIDDLKALVAANVERCDYGFVCLICSRSIKQMTKMRRHMREVHMKPKEYRCPPCNLVFKNRHFGDHVRKFHPDWRGINIDRFLIENS